MRDIPVEGHGDPHWVLKMLAMEVISVGDIEDAVDHEKSECHMGVLLEYLIYIEVVNYPAVNYRVEDADVSEDRAVLEDHEK